MPDFLMSALPHIPGPLLAVLIAVFSQYWMTKRDERRQVRRAFAESINQCCDEMESAAISYWTEDAPGTEALVGKMHAALRKMIRTIATSSCISDDEKKHLQDSWKFINRALLRRFDIEDRKMDAEKAMQVVGIITDIRCEAAKVRA